jgi:hypothetical protein
MSQAGPGQSLITEIAESLFLPPSEPLDNRASRAPPKDAAMPHVTNHRAFFLLAHLLAFSACVAVLGGLAVTLAALGHYLF